MDKGSKMILFLLITFLLPLISIALQKMATNSAIQFILYGIQAASPSIAAIVVLVINGRCKEFFVKVFHTRHLAMSLMIPCVISCATMFLSKIIFSVWFNVDFALGCISGTQFIIILWALIAEEIGWRGYLEMLLRKEIARSWLVPFVVGIIWCLWHYHYFLINGVQVPILLFLFSCVIESYIYSFLMDCTEGNLISAMTYHFTWNLMLHLFAVNPSDNHGSIVPYEILAVLEVVVLLFFWSVNGIKLIKMKENISWKDLY